MATIASLAVNLIAQTNRFTQPLKTAERAVQSFQGSVDKVSQGLERVQSLTGKAATRFLALKAAITLATRQATQYAGAVIAVHQQTGILIESVQGLRFAAQQSSTDISTLEIGLRSLARRAAEASQGNASFAKGFERLGVNVRDASGALKDVETILMEVADGAAAMASEADASAALMLVMGDAGRRLVPFMRQGSEGIRDLMDQAVRLGIVMDENAIRALDALGSEIEITGNRIGALTRDLSYRASPAVGVMLGWINQLIDGFFDLSDEQRQQIVRWTAYAGMLLGAATAVGLLARALAAGMGILRTFGMIAAVAFNPLTLKLVAVGALVAMAIARFDKLKAWWEQSDFGQIVRNAWVALEETWLSDDLTLPEKVIESAKLLVNFILEILGLEWEGDPVQFITDAWESDFGKYVRLAITAFLTLRWAAATIPSVASALAPRLIAMGGLAAAVGRVLGQAHPIARFVITTLFLLDLAWDFLPEETRQKTAEFFRNFFDNSLPNLIRGVIGAAGAVAVGAIVGAGAWPITIAAALTFAVATIKWDFVGAKLQSLWDSLKAWFQERMPLFKDLMEGALSLSLPQLVISVGKVAFDFAHSLWESTFGGGDGRSWSDRLRDRLRQSEPFDRFMQWLARLVFGEEAAQTLRTGGMAVPGFQSGTPWTGWGALDEVAGVVHKQEAVIPWDVLRKGPAAVLEFLGAPGFQEGRYEGIMQAPLFGVGAARQQEQITATLIVPEKSLAHSLVERLRPVLEGIFPGLTDALLSGLDALASGVETAREKLDELMTALEEGPQAIEAAVNALNDMKPAVDDLIVSLTSDRIARLDDLVEIERLLAHVTGQAFDETAFRARELSRAISDAARAMVEAGHSAEEVSEVIAPWVEQLEPLSRELERQQTAQAAVSAAMQTLASRLEDVNSGLASFVRNLRYEAGRVSLDMQSLIADAMSFFIDVVVDLFDTGQAELEQRISSAPDPGTDVLGIAQAFDRFRNLEDSMRQREQELRKLHAQQRTVAERTAGGAAAGAALGAAIGSIIPGVGTILGGLLGGLFGGSSAKKKAQQDLGPQIQATEEKIRELERLIHNARVDLIDALGIAADDFASSIMGAFSAATAKEFGERLGESVRDQLRYAITQLFVADVLAPQIAALAEMVQAAFLEGAPLDMEEIDRQIDSITKVAAQLYDRFEELGLGVKKTNEQFRAMTVNIPLGRRALEAIRFQSATPQSVLSLYSGPELAALSQQSGGDMVFTGSITVVANDPADFERQLRDYQRRQGLRRVGNPTALERVRR